MSKIDGGMPGFFVSIYIQTPFKKGENIHTVWWTLFTTFFPFFNNFWGLLRMYGFEPSFCWFQNLVFFGNVFLHFYINQCYKLASPFLLNQKPIYCTYCETYASGIYKVYSFFFLMAPFFPFFFRLKMGKLRGTVAA